VGFIRFLLQRIQYTLFFEATRSLQDERNHDERVFSENKKQTSIASTRKQMEEHSQRDIDLPKKDAKKTVK
jgi:hypothetical protein